MKFRPPLLTVVAATIVLVSATCGFLYKEESLKAQEKLLIQAMARNDLRAKQLASSVGQLSKITIRLFDNALFQIRDALDHDQSELNKVVDQILKSLPSGAVNLVLVADAAGQVIYSSDGVSQGKNVSDRPYFRVFPESKRDELFFGSPFKGVNAGEDPRLFAAGFGVISTTAETKNGADGPVFVFPVRTAVRLRARTRCRLAAGRIAGGRRPAVSGHRCCGWCRAIRR